MGWYRNDLGLAVGHSLVDGRPLNFATGQPKLSAPDNGDLKAAENTVTGLALAQDGSLYVSYGKRNLVARYGLSDGKLVQKLNVPTPGAMIATSQGAVAVISEQRRRRRAESHQRRRENALAIQCRRQLAGDIE